LRDLEYAKVGDDALKLDLYLPEKSDEKLLPLIVWIHGGGWAAGSKRDCPAIPQVGRGYAVASVDYRLTDKAIFPAQIEDCKAAIRWLRANAKTYKLDADHIAVWGSSAGGHLVALLGTSGQAKQFDVGDNLDFSSRVQAVCDFYGPTDLLQMQKQAIPEAKMNHDDPGSPESRLIGGPIQENKDKAAKANPIEYITAECPPFLIVHGEKDPLVAPGQSRLLYDALKKMGIPAKLHSVPGAGHGGPGFNAPEVREMVDAFFDANLKGPAEK
jgi:acetyl esterase/lipase